MVIFKPLFFLFVFILANRLTVFCNSSNFATGDIPDAVNFKDNTNLKDLSSDEGAVETGDETCKINDFSDYSDSEEASNSVEISDFPDQFVLGIPYSVSVFINDDSNNYDVYCSLNQKTKIIKHPPFECVFVVDSFNDNFVDAVVSVYKNGNLFFEKQKKVEVLKPDHMNFVIVQKKVKVQAGLSEEAFLKDMEESLKGVQSKFNNETPALVVYPEYVGYVNVFQGENGKMASEFDSIDKAFFKILEEYQEVINYYLDIYPGISYARAAYLSLTDSLVYPFVKAFSTLARKYKIYILAATIMPDFKKSYKQEDIDFFGNKSFDKNFVYLPVDERVYNQAVLFSPAGEIKFKVKKVHLVPFEKNVMDIVNGKLEDVKLFSSPAGKIGIAVCLDAFYPDYIDYLDYHGAHILIEESANPRLWASYTDTNKWQPEEWLIATLGPVQNTTKNIKYVLSSMLVGNMMDTTYDGQSSVAVRFNGLPEKTYIGTENNEIFKGNFLKIMPWFAEDPCATDKTLNIDECRQTLNSIGKTLLPGGENENQFVEGAIFVEIPVKE